jgi:hypothetical protein
MNMVKLLRFFLTGPGAVVLVVAVILGVGEIIHKGQERQKTEADKRQVQRPLGQVKPSENVDKSTAPKEVVLSNNRIVPAKSSEQPTPTQTQAVPIANAWSQRQLPQLVSFYAQVPGSSPSPTALPKAIHKTPTTWLPPAIFIPCALVNTVESSHITRRWLAKCFATFTRTGI